MQETKHINKKINSAQYNPWEFKGPFGAAPALAPPPAPAPELAEPHQMQHQREALLVPNGRS
jgi:hypothetical protein